MLDAIAITEHAELHRSTPTTDYLTYTSLIHTFIAPAPLLAHVQ